MSEEWITIQEAARRLNVRRAKISRLVSRGIIKTKDNPLDARVTLVDLEEVRTIFNTYGGRKDGYNDNDNE